MGGARIQTHICLTPGPALKLYASQLTCLESSKGCALGHIRHRGPWWLLRSPVVYNHPQWLHNLVGLHKSELSFHLGGLFSTPLSSLFSVFLPPVTSHSLCSTTRDFRGWVSQALVFLSMNLTAYCLSSWETARRVCITSLLGCCKKDQSLPDSSFIKNLFSLALWLSLLLEKMCVPCKM